MSEPIEEANGEEQPQESHGPSEHKSVGEILDSPETELYWPATRPKKKRLLKVIIIAVILVIAAVAAYVYLSLDMARKDYTRIITPAGIVKVHHGRGANLGAKFLKIELGELNDLIAGFSPEAAENKFGRAFLDNARKQLREKGFTLARPGEKPDPEKALAIIEQLVYGQADLFADAKLDADKDGKPEYASYEELKRKEFSEYIPAELAEEPLYQGYKFELRLGETTDEREAGYVVLASPVTGKGRFYYADQTGVVCSESDRVAAKNSPPLKKIALD